MNYRTARAAIQGWRDRLDRQFSTNATDQQTIRTVFVLWLVAFFFKHAGSGWDVAWHFRYVFGALEPPHWPTIADFARLGVPAALAIMVEVTSFTLMSLFIARQGTLAADGDSRC